MAQHLRVRELGGSAPSMRPKPSPSIARIADGTSAGRTITAAISPVFEAYATIALLYGGEGQEEHDRAVLLRPVSSGHGAGIGPSPCAALAGAGLALAHRFRTALYRHDDTVPVVHTGWNHAGTERRLGASFRG
jgi:hypothetical protein